MTDQFFNITVAVVVIAGVALLILAVPILEWLRDRNVRRLKDVDAKLNENRNPDP